MSPWLIFAVVLGPLAVGTVWISIGQLRGWFVEREDGKPDFFQRHGTSGIILLFLLGGLLAGGPIGVVVSALLLLSLSLITAVIMTAFDGRRHRSRLRALQASGGNLQDLHLDRWAQRFGRNFRQAINEWLSFWS
jgi:hypothetical protein